MFAQVLEKIRSLAVSWQQGESREEVHPLTQLCVGLDLFVDILQFCNASEPAAQLFFHAHDCRHSSEAGFVEHAGQPGTGLRIVAQFRQVIGIENQHCIRVSLAWSDTVGPIHPPHAQAWYRAVSPRRAASLWAAPIFGSRRRPSSRVRKVSASRLNS